MGKNGLYHGSEDCFWLQIEFSNLIIQLQEGKCMNVFEDSGWCQEFMIQLNLLTPKVANQIQYQQQLGNSKIMEGARIKIIKCGSNQFGIFEDIIGEGGSAVVKKGYNKSNPTELYAVKIININDLEKKQLALKQLQIMEQLPSHPNLVRIQKIKVQSQNNIYIFMEYCNGGTLFDLVNKQKLSEDKIYDLFCQLMKGYKVLYDNKVLHEDIKLQNILIHEDVYKITDFGLAITCQNFKYGIRRKGTLSYMPYQKLTKKDYIANVKCDIYSFGVVMYEVICGRHPYISGKQTSASWTKQFREAKLRDDLLGKYSLKFRPFFDIVLQMVAKLQGHRIDFQTLWKFYESYEHFEPFRKPKGGGMKIKPQIPQKFSIIATSQANITNFGEPQQDRQMKVVKQECQYNRKISQFISVIIKSIELFKKDSQQKECQQLELILHLARAQIMKSAEIDWFTASQSVKQYCQSYESDCKFVRQQLLDFLSETSLKQASKHRMTEMKTISSTQQLFQYINKYIMVLFKQRFTTIRINYSKQIQLLFYLISFVKLVDEKQITLERLEQIQRDSEEDKRIKPEVQLFLQNEEIMIDGDDYNQKQLSQEFELLTFD